MKKLEFFLEIFICFNCMNLNRVCHGFGFMKQDYYFRVDFDHF
jgi:hypothetical protein